MKKHIFYCFMIIGLLISSSALAEGFTVFEKIYKVNFEGKELVVDGNPAFSYEGNVMVPLDLLRKMDLSVTLDGENINIKRKKEIQIKDGNIYNDTKVTTEKSYTGGQLVKEQFGVDMSKDFIYYFKFKLNDADDYFNIFFKENGNEKLSIGFGYDWEKNKKDGSSISVFDRVSNEKKLISSKNMYTNDNEVVVWYDKKWNYFNLYLNNQLVASWKPSTGGVDPLKLSRVGILIGNTTTGANFQYHYMGYPLVTAIGDSITAGAKLHAPNPDYYEGLDNYNSNYPSLLSSFFKEQGILNYFVVNKGVNGETTDQIRKRFENDVVSTKSKYVFIHGGINDWTLTTQTKVEDAVNNKINMADIALKNNITPFLLGVTPTRSGEPYTPFSNELYKKESALYGNYKFIPLWSTIIDKTNLDFANKSYLIDGVHPNTEGYKSISTEIIKKISN